MLLAALVSLTVVAALVITSGSRGDARRQGPPATAVGAAAPAAKAGTAATAPKRADAQKVDSRATIHIATLNLKASMNAERGHPRHPRDHRARRPVGHRLPGARRQPRPDARRPARLWQLVMPTHPHGADLNPIAFDTRVWELKHAWPALLTDHTWRARRGNIAIAQYAVVATLQHRQTGRLIRAASFHMPPRIHNQSGGPNYGLRPRVEAFWRMAASVDKLARSTPDERPVRRDVRLQRRRRRATAPTSCSRAASSTRSTWRPTTTCGGNGTGMSIDYVMTPLHGEEFDITDFVRLDGLITDHPAIVTKLKESKASYRDRSLVDVTQLLLTSEEAASRSGE